LSAFTWALGREIETGGAAISASAFCAAVDQRLLALNMRQTPIVEAPIAHAGWLTQTLIGYGAATGASTAAEPETPAPETSPSDGLFDSFLQSLGVGA
jgi:hypothetical protein